jgi:hypothetical protein
LDGAGRFFCGQCISEKVSEALRLPMKTTHFNEAPAHVNPIGVDAYALPGAMAWLRV